MSSKAIARSQQRRKRKMKTVAVDDEVLMQEEQLRAKHLKKLAEKPDTEKCLEELVFGGEDEFVENLIVGTKETEEALGIQPSSDSDDDHPKSDSLAARKPVWEDDDDLLEESIEMTHRYRRDIRKSREEKTLGKEKLQIRLQEEFQKAMGGVPSWAARDHKKRDSDEDDEDESSDEENEDNLLSKTGNLLTKSSSLPKGILAVKRCLNANHERLSKVPLSTVQFHPLAQVVMTAGVDCTISLFQVDGKLNPKIQSIYLESFPIFKAQFSADGEQVVATGMRHKLFYVYDMMGGNIIPIPSIRGLNDKRFQQFEVSPDGSYLLLNGSAGFLHLLSMKTKELIGSMKMNGKSVKAAFTPDCSKIISNSDDGCVYIWDVNSRKCLNKFVDDGSIRGTTIALSGDGRYLACGSNTGVVNIYNSEDCLQTTAPKPLKTVMNLVTSASTMVFNSKTEILAVASNKMDDAVKLIHIPSWSVFSNFPQQSKRKRIHLTRSMDFSPRSGFFSIANNRGEALLYRLKHYTDF
ncbi:U3 small nucleolar RNA-associated protein 18 homolog [Spea bombifrons]|uniref:U3 small nucleolar RNA-associated protein 18 homolog n=1 Tax=Spea bombifrons TaxID=233779 RepID=UPI002349CA6E|nr:U3 small nucleolar RNA-associated protein 18 homolog [Spea bombifrons]